MDADIARTLWKVLVVHESETGESFMMDEDFKRVALPKFSTDVDEAYRVVAFMQSHNWTLSLKQEIEHGKSIYMATFMKNDNRSYIFNRHESLPMVLCLAALAALSGLNILRN
jgi:hypothetical protein